MTRSLKGSMVAIVTPMHEDGELDLVAFRELVEWHIREGTSAIVVVGTTGESATLTTQEHCDLVGYCVDVANKRIPIIAGTGSNSTDEALYYTKSAEECGADACLLVAPYYNKPTQEGLYNHFRLIAEEVDLPQILYNVPGRTACDMELDLIDRLADLDNIVALKDATGDIVRGKQLIDTCGERIQIYCGEDAITLELMKLGATGTISVTSNIAPDLMAEMCNLALANEFKLAGEIDEKLQILHRCLFLESNPIPVKWALNKMGRIKDGIRLPLMELSGMFHAELIKALKQVDIDINALE